MTSKATNDIAILEEKKKREQTLWQWRIFISVYAGYMCYYFTRRSFSLVLPALLRDPSFAHLNKDKVSIVGTVMGITYSLGKVGMGVVADGLSPRVSLSVGLFICACTNLLLSQFSSIGLFAFLWGINGFLQGGGWAACSQLLTQWFPRERVGTIWGITTTSQNVGAALVAILCSYLSEMYGWRVAMWVPGVIGLLVACLAAWGVRVSPASVGLPPANKAASPHEVKASKVESREAKEDQGHNSSLSNATKPSIFEIFRDSYVLMLGIASCLVYGVRIAISDWLALYLVEGKGFSQITAGGCVAWFELGGIAGATVSGLASDRLCAGKRGPPVVLLIAGLFFNLPLLLVVDDTLQCSLLIFSMGFLLYGSNMLVGIFVAEVANPVVKATAQGLTGAWAGVGGALANYPLGLVISLLGWSHFFLVLMLCCFFTMLVVLPMWHVCEPKKQKTA